MTRSRNTPQGSTAEDKAHEYEDYLRLLPLSDLRAELERLDEFLDEGDTPPVGLARELRSDIAFKWLIRRGIEDPLNGAYSTEATKVAILQEMLLLRFAASQIDLQMLEYKIRHCISKLDATDDPDTSSLQNLISVLVSRLSAAVEEGQVA